MPFYQLDALHRSLGQAMDRLGAGSTGTPGRTLFARPEMRLEAYSSGQNAGPALLIVPAPIKRSYIWDLFPGASVVRHALTRGFRTYLIQWQDPGPNQKIGLSEYADRFIADSLHAVEADSGPHEVFLAGHSLGGTFSAIFSSLHPERVSGLVLLGAPVNFEADSSKFGPWVSLAPRAQIIRALLGNVPGSFLNWLCYTTAPETFIAARLMDWLMSLGDADALLNHIRVSRWMLDEMAMPGRLFDEIVELLYRENRFIHKRLKIGNLPANPEHIHAPVLSVVDPRCAIAPERAVIPLFDLVASKEQKVLLYEGDTGVALQHLGMLVGKTAHRRLWPQIFDWMHSCRRS